jgi:uncharacterized protein (TIGR02996 family)
VARATNRFPTHGPDLKALLTACHAEPDDDTPRLVLADWLEEHDDPRGEMVRLQVRLAALPAGAPEYDDLFDRHQKWWKKYGSWWQKDVGMLIWDSGPHNRGLPTLGHYDDEDCWLQSGDLRDPAKYPKNRLSATIAAGWPGMTWVLPTPLCDEAEQYDEYEDDYDDEDDDMGGEYDPETDEFIEPPEVDPFEPFHQPPWAGSPTPIGIAFPEGITVTAERLDQVAKVPNLRGLSLADTFPEPGLLARIAKIKTLEHLDLGNYVRLTDEVTRTLAPLKKLRTLIALDGSITNAGAAILAKFTELRHLRLGTRRLTAPGYQALVKLTKLESLSLEKADDAAVRHLSGLKRLRRLDLSGTKVTGRGLNAFPLLTNLTLDSTQTNDEGLACIARLPRLRELNVSGTRVTGPGFTPLAGLRWLENLSAAETDLRDKDLVHFEGLKNLKWLSVWGTHLTKKGTGKLQKKLKKTTIFV